MENFKKEKFFIVGLYSGLNTPFECFRCTELFFDSFLSCIDWIESHKKYFAPSVRFGVFSVDNNFEYGRSEDKNL